MLPDKGLLGGHAIFDPAMLDTPAIDAAFLAQQSDTEAWRVEVKRRNEVSTITYPYNPLDAVGWHGELAPVRINVRDIRPVMSHRYHIPPSVHTTFLSGRFASAPSRRGPSRPTPARPRCPSSTTTTTTTRSSSITPAILQPRQDPPRHGDLSSGGFTHGPHPKAFARMLEQVKPATDEDAVMVDARDPLDVAEAGVAVEWADYVNSWKPKAGAGRDGGGG